MDSGNSGSLQSSSGGDEEYDSRADSISAFTNPKGHVGPMSNHPPPPLHNHPTSFMFDPPPNYFEPMPPPPQAPSNPNSVLNLDMVWSKTLRSEPNCSEIINPIMPSSSSLQPFFLSHQDQYHGPFTTQSPPVPFLPPVPETTTTSDQNQVVRNPKKRSRASRRTPTTVLTTDTTNFRAMVQEFTGIPAPPFTSSSSFPRSRLDLFGTPSTIRSQLLDPSQRALDLLRPFAHKVQPYPPFFSSSLFNSSNNITSSGSTRSASNSTSINMQNPFLTFQSLLQPPDPKYPLANSGSTTDGSFEIHTIDSNLKMGVFEEHGLSHRQVLVSPAPSWGDGVLGSNVADHQSHHQSFVNGSFSSLRNVKNGKPNNSVSSSSNRNPVSENVSTRSGEVMVEPWISSSD
ncbi:unnamed protein product [Ilex paraguariensis]|uniref:VQ domain-containing protein n=1 Tax=Ilex paraguariensis TaxID=185542 RepID=A0ABC8QRQ9_9AQUA